LAFNINADQGGTRVKSDETQRTLEELETIRRQLDELRQDWDAHHDATDVVRGLKELSASSAAYPSIEALLFGAAKLIERGEAVGHRLEKLSDHLHGYVVGWEDAAQAGAS
jgi:hypothetical protein